MAEVGRKLVQCVTVRGESRAFPAEQVRFRPAAYGVAVRQGQALVAQAQMEMQLENPIHPGGPPFSFTVTEGGDPVEYTGTYGSAAVSGTAYYWTVSVVVDPRLPGRESFPLAAYVLNPEQWDLK